MTIEKLNELLDMCNRAEQLKRAQGEIFSFLSTGKGDFNDPAKRSILKIMTDLEKVAQQYYCLRDWDLFEGVREIIEANITNKILELDKEAQRLQEEFAKL
jgi:hypothetical protein